MSEEEKNIEWICSRTLLNKDDELVPIILSMLSETYISGLKQGHFDRDLDLKKQIEEKDKIIDEMAEQLTTPIHGKKYVINYYKSKVEEE